MPIYCEKFGFDAQRRAALLRLAEIGLQDQELIERLHRQVLDPHAEDLIESFYAHMMRQPEFASLLEAGGFELDRLRRSQRTYLETLGIDADSVNYFEGRLRIGVAHAWAGVRPDIYLCSFHYLQRLIIAHLADRPDRAALTDLVIRLTALDSALALETYHRAQLGALEASAEQERARRSALSDALSRDPLTGLANRRGLDTALAQTQGACAVIMADLDHFKRINDTHGHAVGDAVLRGVAARLAGAVKSQDTVGRYGGEEFLVVLPGATRETALKVAERMRRRVADSPVLADHIPVELSASFGVSAAILGRSDSGQHDRDEIVREADAALYRAKRAGRNRVVLAPPVPPA